MAFDKDNFSDLLIKAKGSRSIRDYAKEAGVSAAHISRFINQINNTPPEPDTLQKLASAAHNGVTYEDLLIAAGHITTLTTFSPELPEGYGDMSFLDENLREWIRNPQNAQYIEFVYKANKRGITKEALRRAHFTVNING